MDEFIKEIPFNNQFDKKPTTNDWPTIIRDLAKYLCGKDVLNGGNKLNTVSEGAELPKEVVEMCKEGDI
jgi:hypothetical protein